jgi:hypothetical protein
MPVSKKARCRTGARWRAIWRRLLPNSRDDAIAKAQDVMYEAWDRAISRSRIALAHKALAISPLCADAHNLLGGEAATIAEARDPGELALGPESYMTVGGADEATDYVRDCGPAWHETPGALGWLNKLLAALPKEVARVWNCPLIRLGGQFCTNRAATPGSEGRLGAGARSRPRYRQWFRRAGLLRALGQCIRISIAF